MINTFGVDYWIGANDHDKDGKFVWEDGNDFGFTNWARNKDNGKDCVAYGSGGRWWKLDCSHRYSFLCKYTDPSFKEKIEEKEAARKAAEEAARVAAEEECQKLETDENLYSFHEIPKKWDQAAAVCKDNGGALASIHCDRENEFVTATFPGAEFWIGATDKIYEGEFTWEDESKFRYTK